MEKIVINGPEDVAKQFDAILPKLEEHGKALADIKDADAQRAEVEKELKELRETVKKIGSRYVTQDGGVKAEVPLTKDDWKNHGMKAIHELKTPVQMTDAKNPQDRFKSADGPVGEFQDAADALLVLSTALKVHPRETGFYKSAYQPALQRAVGAFKDAMDTSTTDPGVGDWIPTRMSPRLVDKVRLNLNVASLFPEMAMPGSTYEIPVWLNDFTGYLISEVGGFNPTSGNIGDAAGTTEITGKVTMTAAGIGGVVGTTKFAEEDSIVPVLPFITNGLSWAIRNGIEQAIINGDTTATHQDADVTASTDARKAWKGLRWYGLQGAATKDASGNKINTNANWAAYVQALRGAMGVYGGQRSNLAYIVGFNQLQHLLAIPDFRTQYAFGSSATNAGVDADPAFRPDGIRVVVSEFQREDVDATGVNSAAGPNTFTTGILVNTNSYLRGNLRNITLQVLREVWAIYDQDGVLATWRGAFVPLYGSGAGQKHTGIVYDIAV